MAGGNGNIAAVHPAREMPNDIENGENYEWNNDRLRVTDMFGWQELLYDPAANNVPPTRYGDVQNMTRRSADTQLQQQPDDYEEGEETIIGPNHGQSVNSPWFGNVPRDLSQQENTPDGGHGVLTATGGTSAVKTWRQWLAATEVPDSTVASEVFASVRDFPYSFKG
jgi:hypothetical protein